MRKKYIYCLLITVIALSIKSQESSAFLNYHPSSVGEGTQGNMYTYTDEDLGMFFYNPANSSNENSSNFCFCYEHKFLMSNLSQYNSASIMFPSIRDIRLGVGYIGQTISNIPVYPEYTDSVSFLPEGYFSDNANCILINMSYGYTDKKNELFAIKSGFNVKSIINKIDTNYGMGTGFDFGINGTLYLFSINRIIPGYVNVAFSLRDVAGTKMTWDTPSNHEDVRAMMYNVGASYNIDVEKIKSKFTIECTYHYVKTGETGVSFLYKYNKLFGLFSGFNYIRNEEFSYKNIGVGAFVDILGAGIYYGLSSAELGYNHSIGIRYQL